MAKKDQRVAKRKIRHFDVVHSSSQTRCVYKPAPGSLKITNSGDNRSVTIDKQVIYQKASYRGDYSQEAEPPQSEHGDHHSGNPETEWIHRPSPSPLEALKYIHKELPVLQYLRDVPRGDYTRLAGPIKVY
jgi:hypothetical protein